MVEDVTIRVPRNATAGERYAVIWAEASASAPGGGGVRLVNRVHIRVYLTVDRGGAAPMFTLSGLHADRSGGEALIVAAVHNTGGSTPHRDG